MIRCLGSMLALAIVVLAACVIAVTVNNANPVVDPAVARPAVRPVHALLSGDFKASDYFMAYMVPLPPEDKRGNAVATPVFFADQAGIDALCGGKDVVACAIIGGGAMALPNPCQPRFAGESYAAVVCHEKGHTLGWSHGDK